MPSQYGTELKKRRESLGITREALGASAGISASTVRQIEVGSIKRPPLKRLEGFASCLGWPVAEQCAVLGGKDRPQPVVLCGRVCSYPALRVDAEGRELVTFGVRVSGEPWLVKAYGNADELSRRLQIGAVVWVEGAARGGSGVLASSVNLMRTPGIAPVIPITREA